MESKEVLLNGKISNGDSVVSYGNGLVELHGENGFKHVGGEEIGNGSLADEVLEDLEEYWEDINDRLMISRLVGDSIIKGMVTAVEQDATEKIRIKDLELANLRKSITPLEANNGESEFVRLPMKWRGCKLEHIVRFFDSGVENDKMREDLHALRNGAREQIEKAKNEIECVRGCNSMKKIGSGSELVGLGGILQKNQSESSLHLDKIFGSLKSTLDTVFTKVDRILLSSKNSLSKWQEEIDVSEKIENTVMETLYKNQREEFEEKMWEHNSQNKVNWFEKLNHISGLLTQLDSIVKALFLPEACLVAHGSRDLDHLHQKGLNNHVKMPNSLNEENGTLEASNTHIPESYDFQQLKHMSKEDMVSYFNNIIINLRRDHESALHEVTEKHFRLKRERGYSVTHRKGEEFDVLRKKIPEVILKLENFLLESESFPKLAENTESLTKLKDRFGCLLSENRKLRDCLANKKNEVKCLEAQVSDAVGKLLQHSLAKDNLQKLVADLESSVKDSYIEASLNEEVYKCTLRELIGQMKSDSEDSAMEFFITQEIHDIDMREASIPAETRGTYEIEDPDIESLIYQEVSDLIFRETITDVQEKLTNLHREVMIEKENESFLGNKLIEKENELRLDIEEKEILKQELLVLETAMEQRERLVEDLSVSLSKEREHLEVVFRDLGSLSEDLHQQQLLVAEKNSECEVLSAELLEAVEHIEADKMEIHELNEKLHCKIDELAKANEETSVAFALSQERLDKLLLSEAREKKIKEEMGLSVVNIHGLSKIFDDFEYRISRAIMENNTRLENEVSHLEALTNTASVLRRTGLIYKKKLERRCADLQTAETEVDLLGDEVEALLGLFEKIYIALDHYSPILKHYPGIIEILELVRRKLSHEPIKRSPSAASQG